MSQIEYFVVVVTERSSSVFSTPRVTNNLFSTETAAQASAKRLLIGNQFTSAVVRRATAAEVNSFDGDIR